MLYYATDIFEGSYALKKQPDGTYVFGLPVPPTTTVPIIDVGCWLRGAVRDLDLHMIARLSEGVSCAVGCWCWSKFTVRPSFRQENNIHSADQGGVHRGDRDARLRAHAGGHVRGLRGPWV